MTHGRESAPAPEPPVPVHARAVLPLGELGFFDGTRVELIFGEVVEMSPINWSHVLACRKTAELLARIFAGAAWIGSGGPLNLAHSEPERGGRGLRWED